MAKRNIKIKEVQATAVIQQNMYSKCICAKYNKKQYSPVYPFTVLQSGSHPQIIQNSKCINQN